MNSHIWWWATYAVGMGKDVKSSVRQNLRDFHQSVKIPAPINPSRNNLKFLYGIGIGMVEAVVYSERDGMVEAVIYSERDGMDFVSGVSNLLEHFLLILREANDRINAT
ncbi:hypothetical protein [Neomicrococcus lactis]|uniref:hypothetical protein n=1 Tax=Neomicrococcus lactis TaxID=732241 RepID=UPI0023013099|nr:hypothetical protein [Neomicrococcus lactis]